MKRKRADRINTDTAGDGGEPEPVAKVGNDAKTASSNTSSSDLVVFRKQLRQQGYLPTTSGPRWDAQLKAYHRTAVSAWKALHTTVTRAVSTRLKAVGDREDRLWRSVGLEDLGALELRICMAERLEAGFTEMLQSTRILLADMQHLQAIQQGEPEALKKEAQRRRARYGPCYEGLLRLPDEIWICICEAVEPRSLAALACTCKALGRLVSVPLLWKRKLRARLDRMARTRIWHRPLVNTVLSRQQLWEQWEQARSKACTLAHAPGIPLAQVPLAQLYPKDPGLFRELYIRLWNALDGPRCGLCRRNQRRRPVHWTYPVGTPLIEGLLHWHEWVVEAICLRCSNTHLMTTAGIKRSRLLLTHAYAKGVTLAKGLGLRWLTTNNSHVDKDLRFFVEDVLAAVLRKPGDGKTRAYVPRFRSRLPHRLLPKVQVEGGSRSFHTGAWHVSTPSVFCYGREGTGTASHRCTKWEPGAGAPPLTKRKRTKEPVGQVTVPRFQGLVGFSGTGHS